MPCPQCGRGFGNTIELCPYCSSPRAQQPQPQAQGRTTASHVANYDEPAGFWLRFFAYLYDCSIVALFSTLAMGVTERIAAALTSFALSLSSSSDGLHTASGVAIGSAMAVLATMLVIIVVNLLYCPIFEASKLAATPGKILLGLRVTTAGGDRVTILRAVGRNLGKILSSLTFGVGYLLAGFTANKQALHDMIADCAVVRGPVVFSGQRFLAALLSIPLAVGVSYLTEGKEGRGRHPGDRIQSHLENLENIASKNHSAGIAVGTKTEEAPVPYLNKPLNTKFTSQAVSVEGTVGMKAFRATAVDFDDKTLVVRHLGGKGSLVAFEILLPDKPRSGEGFVAGGSGWKNPQVTLVKYEPGDAQVTRQLLQLPYTLRIDFGLVGPDSAAGRIEAVFQSVPARMSGSFSLGGG